MSQTPLGVTSPPMGWFESHEGDFQKLGRLSRPSTYHLLTCSLRDLRGFDREGMPEVDRESGPVAVKTQIDTAVRFDAAL
eukprot:6873182-Prymnesium_polylepis.1